MRIRPSPPLNASLDSVDVLCQTNLLLLAKFLALEAAAFFHGVEQIAIRSMGPSSFSLSISAVNK